jgi:hypothetical protein
MLSHAADGIAVAVLQPGASFAAMRSAHLQQPSDDFWRARVRALQLTQAQINSIVAAMAVHKPLQEALLEEQEQLLAQVEALLQPHAQQQQQERQQDGTQAQDGVAEGCAQDGPALGGPQQQQHRAKWGQHHPPKLPRVKVVPAVPPPFGARMVSCYGLQKLLPQWQQCVRMGCQTLTRWTTASCGRCAGGWKQRPTSCRAYQLVAQLMLLGC